MSSISDIPNDPRKVSHPPARPTVVRSSGTTRSEEYLAKLGERSFLNLWSYPNVFRDQRAAGKGDGKELCDQLVVCGNHVLIFSDKSIAWPSAPDLQIAWKRWSRRSIAESVRQIRGAERWITEFPNRIFLDRQCTCPFPLKLPPPEERTIHGIVVALGAGDACKAYFCEGIGSLMIDSSVQGDAHWTGDTSPFTVGDVDPSGAFVHVLDDATLDIVLSELDTITDFTAYLSKKEGLIRSNRLVMAGGEEDLVAYYMTHMNERGEHDFTTPDGSSLGDEDSIVLEPGLYGEVSRNAQYVAKKQADKNSYVWDRLIEAFTTPMLEGTSLVSDGIQFELSEQEVIVRHMAMVPRLIRRSLGNGILDALATGSTTQRFTRAFLPDPGSRERDTAFFIMTLEVPRTEIPGGYKRYRSVRTEMLKVYALSLLQKHPNVRRVVGVATEPLSRDKIIGSSEDLMLLEAPEWTPELLRNLAEQRAAFDIMKHDAYREYAVHDEEYPQVPTPRVPVDLAKPNRHERRAVAAKMRRGRGKRRG